MEQPPTRKNGTPDLSGDWPGEGPPPEVARPAETGGLAGFPSEGFPSEPHAPETLFGPHVVSPPVEPSEADRRRLFPPVRRRRFSAARLSRAAVPVLGTLGVAAVVAIVVLDFLVRSSSRPAPEAPVTVRRAPLALAIPLPSQEVVNSIPSPPVPIKETPPPRRSDAVVASVSRVATRPSTARVTSPPSAPIWPPALAVVRAASSEFTPISTLVGRTSVPLPTAPPTPEPAPEAALSASEAPPVSTPETAVRAARTQSARLVVDRYRDAFNSLDANAVDAFWPGVDRQALKKTFAQLESQHLQFGRCDVQLAGARAFASCNGYAQYTKTGSRDPRLEVKRWTFTLGEVKDGWVILGVDARQVR